MVLNRFTLVLIVLLVGALGAVQHFYLEAQHQRSKVDQLDTFFLEIKPILRERNSAGEEKATVKVDVLDEKIFQKVVGSEIKALEARFNTKLDRVYQKSDMRIITRLDQLKMAKKDTTVQVVMSGNTVLQKGHVMHYRDAYNQLTMVDIGNDTPVVSGTIRNDLTQVIYEGNKPRFLWVLPQFWKKRPVFSETYLYNPLSGMDTLRTVITNRRVKL